MEREVLKQVIADQQEYRSPKSFFSRTLTQTLLRFADDPSIMIISGIRKSGKSTIQRLLQLELAKSDYYLNFDDERLIPCDILTFDCYVIASHPLLSIDRSSIMVIGPSLINETFISAPKIPLAVEIPLLRTSSINCS